MAIRMLKPTWIAEEDQWGMENGEFCTLMAIISALNGSDVVG